MLKCLLAFQVTLYLPGSVPILLTRGMQNGCNCNTFDDDGRPEDDQDRS